MQDWKQNLSQLFAQQQQPAQAAKMSAYLRHQFDFFGLAKPQRAQLFAPFYQQLNFQNTDPALLVAYCYEQPQREYQYFAIDWVKKNQKKLPLDSIAWVEKAIVSRSWWDTVDTWAGNIAGAYFSLYPQQIAPITSRWINSDNLWLQRSAIIFQLLYKQRTDKELLFRYCAQFSDSKEFFIQKAIGWALRNYAKTDPQAVIDFVSVQPLPALSKREALKHLC